MEKFLAFCKYSICETLTAMTDPGQQVCGIELVNDLIQRVKAENTSNCSDYEAKIYLIGWWDAVSSIYDYQTRLYGRALYNPFKNQKDFYLQMICDGIDILLFQCDSIRESQDMSFLLNEENVNSIINETEKITALDFSNILSAAYALIPEYSA